MATNANLRRLASRIDAAIARRDPDSGPITVTVFRGETETFALARHSELRPDHIGRPYILSYSREERLQHLELLATSTPSELKALLAAADGNSRGLPENGSGAHYLRAAS